MGNARSWRRYGAYVPSLTTRNNQPPGFLREILSVVIRGYLSKGASSREAKIKTRAKATGLVLVITSKTTRICPVFHLFLCIHPYIAVDCCCLEC
jgi:hypothetical protein